MRGLEEFLSAIGSTRSLRKIMKIFLSFIAAFVGVGSCSLAWGGHGDPEEYVASIRSVEQAKHLLRSALTAECGTGSCADTNAAEVCNLIGAVDIGTGGKVLSVEGNSSSKSQFSISVGDLKLMKRIWRGCRPTNYQYWRHAAVLHVAYGADAREIKDVAAALGIRGQENQDSPSQNRSDSPGVGSSSDKEFARCLNRVAATGEFSSLDGGRSARSLLEGGCQSQYSIWVDSCVKAGSAQRECVLKAAVLAQAAIRLGGR